MTRGRLVSFPSKGAFRVHRTPTKLILRARPRHRYDDPHAEYSVWYFASNLRGSMVEVLDHFRTNTETEALLGSVSGVSGLDIIAVDGVDNPMAEEFAGSVPSRYLAESRLAKAILEPNPGKTFVIAEDEAYLSDMNLQPAIRQVLDSEGSDAFGSPPTLNPGNVQSAHPAARRLTQALSREAYLDERGINGLRYISRHTNNEECWAVFDDDAAGRPKVNFISDEPLDPLDRHHRAAVQSAAELLKLELPALWSI